MSRNYGMGSKSESSSSFFLLLSLWLRRLLSKFEPPAALGTSILGDEGWLGGGISLIWVGLRRGKPLVICFKKPCLWIMYERGSTESVVRALPTLRHESLIYCRKKETKTHASGLCMATWILWVSDVYTYHHHFAWWPLWIMLRRKLICNKDQGTGIKLTSNWVLVGSGGVWVFWTCIIVWTSERQGGHLLGCML